MKQKKNLFVANWKMQLSFNKARELAQVYRDQHEKLHTDRAHIILCPASEALASCAQIVEDSDISIGAQLVSEHPLGAYTGQVAAQSVAEIGCSHALAGHSERRQHNHESNDQIARQVAQMIQNGIVPIICIGETHEDYKSGNGIPVLERQLASLFEIINSSQKRTEIVFAYEPIWSIGTGIIPESEYLRTMFSWLDGHVQAHMPDREYTLLYGGSVNENNTHSLRRIDHMHGFLIGGASLDFQKFQKIVSLWYTE